ncbi:MAG TPA: RT0821/Lpp0805 family surface protein [Alphaproteobacteria bacterium]|jgi:surface antigen|nr:RT0821/Lpp0805 family surface protein [Alphaproteobacteria bacterium]
MNMHSGLKILTVAAMALSLAACESTGGQKQTGGAILGGIGGAAIGSQFGKGTGQIVGVAAGTLLGALVGSEVGRSLDKADMEYANRANQQATTAPIGAPIRWNNPQSGNSGIVTPVRDGVDSSSGAYCREFQQTVSIGGKTQQAYGTACRQPDGTWKVIGS